jgi:hypothetical protein
MLPQPPPSCAHARTRACTLPVGRVSPPSSPRADFRVHPIRTWQRTAVAAVAWPLSAAALCFTAERQRLGAHCFMRVLRRGLCGCRCGPGGKTARTCQAGSTGGAIPNLIRWNSNKFDSGCNLTATGERSRPQQAICNAIAKLGSRE